MANETIFTRYKNNPIIKAEAVPGANSIFNSAVIRYGDGYVGVFRVDMQAASHQLHLGRSKDGLNWEIEPNRINFTGNLQESGASGFGYDPRITEIEGEYYITWCYYPGGGPCIGLGKTKDFKSFEQLAVTLLPYNRNAALFPRKINGKYAILHRPSDTGHTPFGDIYYATSPDLINWGEHRYLFGPKSWWEGTKVGAGPAPIETSEGWLLLYHGVRTTCNGMIYCGGGAILDLDEPWKVRFRSQKYLLAPTELYEIAGDVPNVVFPNAAVIDGDDLTMYYGAADTSVAVAHAKLSKLLDFIKENSI